MPQTLCKLDILGVEVTVYAASNEELLEIAGAAADARIAGSYNVASATIYLNKDMASTHFRPTLAHEVTEYLLGTLNCVYDPEEPHSSFQDFWRILWHIHQTNQEFIYGDALVRTMKELDNKEE